MKYVHCIFRVKLNLISKIIIHYLQCLRQHYKLPFWKWFNVKYPYTTNYTDYKLAVKAYMHQSLMFDEMCLALDFYSDTSYLPHTRLISKMNGTSLTIALNMSVWKKVFHNTYGVCYTFHSNYYWTR